MSRKIKVSVCCVTYNQRDYIREALDSFLNQKTNFSYEIVIHDDASNDGTKEIIEEYAKRYSNVVPIYEKYNQYSKNPNSIMDKVFAKANGEYIALCDGDDGWLDEYKLQKQVDYMDKHKDIKLCSHNTKMISANGEYIEDMIPYQKGIVTISDYLSQYESMHTSSMLFRKKDVQELPDYFYKATVGDLPLKLHLLSMGNCYHMDEIMSFYRTNAKGSWTMYQKNNQEKTRKNYEMEINVYEMFNEQTNYQYNGLIETRILNKKFDYYRMVNDLRKLKKKEYKGLYKKLSLSEKIKLNVKNIPGFYKVYTKIKYRSR